MHRLIPTWLVQLAWFVAGIFATGATWFFLSKGDIGATWLSVFGALSTTAIAVALQRLSDNDRRYRKLRESLGQFLLEGSALMSRIDSDPLPVADANAWNERVKVFLAKDLDASYVARFSNFSGMTFYGGGSERSNLRNSLQGRTHRLHEFLKEFAG